MCQYSHIDNIKSYLYYFEMLTILLTLITSLIPLDNSLLDIDQHENWAVFRFYDLQKNLIAEIKDIPIYSYKIASDKQYLYLITDKGLEVYNALGHRTNFIGDWGHWAFSSDNKYMACASEKKVRIYKEGQKDFEILLPSAAIHSIIFSPYNQYIGVICRNHFLLINLLEKKTEWLKEFSRPLIWGKFHSQDTILLVTEERNNLCGHVYIINTNGQLITNVPFSYQNYEEQIQNIEIVDQNIVAQTHLRKWVVTENKANEDTESQLATNSIIKLSGDSISWPLGPLDVLHPIGNNWGEFQNYGGLSYYHPGVDILSPYQPNVPVYAVKRGYVKAWLTTGNYLYWRLAIADSSLNYTDSCDAYLYAHIDSSRFHKNVGDTVEAGELIGYLVYWPVDSAHFHHLHFAKIRDRGATWPVADWDFVFNPLLSLHPNFDTFPPTFENARVGSLLAFCRNNTSTYLSPTNLNGDVDIIAKVYDKFSCSTGDTIWDRLIPLKIEYEITGPQSKPRELSFIFDKRIAPTNTINVVYKEDNVCRSRGDYNYRDYYFIVTNTDGDSIIELTDASFAWRTSEFPNGEYWIKVYATDASNNTTVCSMLVTVNNPQGISYEQSNLINNLAFRHQIYGVLGQKTYSPLTSLPSGVYFILNENKRQKLLVLGKTFYLK